MASAIYDKGREGIIDRTVDLTGDVRCVLVRSGYTFSASDQFLSSVTTGQENGRSAALASKTYTSGVFDAADTTVTATAAAVSNALVLFQHTGSDATARLIAYIDTATGLPFTPSVSQVVNIVWDNTTNKIAKI